jgi:molybdopterin-guanine dinucleotide biosynthesis protein A
MNSRKRFFNYFWPGLPKSRFPIQFSCLSIKSRNAAKPTLEACILAGGLSSRMGREKSRLHLAGRTMLARVRAAVKPLGLPVRVIRRDLVPRCGPIGGIYTALRTTRANTVLFLPCDMPFLTTELLRFFVTALRSGDSAVFQQHGALAGFPCLLRREMALPIVERQIARNQFSLQSLAKTLRARLIRPNRDQARTLANVNTPMELKLARERLAAGKAGLSARTARARAHKLFKHGLSKRRAPSSL